jgi:hypothetical protein
MRPVWGQLERPGAAGRVWRASQARFVSNVLGPRFEQVCRDWALADPGGVCGEQLVARVGRGVVNDPGRRTRHEVDVAVLGVGGPGVGGQGQRTPLLSIGEAKWGEIMGVGHLERLRRIRDLIANGGRLDTTGTRLVCYSGAGFSPELSAAARAGQVTLVGLDEVYQQLGSPR